MVNLSAEYVPMIKRAFDNNTRLMDLLEEMRMFPLKINNETTTGGKRRKNVSILDVKK